MIVTIVAAGLTQINRMKRIAEMKRGWTHGSHGTKSVLAGSALSRDLNQSQGAGRPSRMTRTSGIRNVRIGALRHPTRTVRSEVIAAETVVMQGRVGINVRFGANSGPTSVVLAPTRVETSGRTNSALRAQTSRAINGPNSGAINVQTRSETLDRSSAGNKDPILGATSGWSEGATCGPIANAMVTGLRSGSTGVSMIK
ncbi:MAG: hypothetical protein ACXW32_16610 [Limisphaerales bacterium]